MRRTTVWTVALFLAGGLACASTGSGGGGGGSGAITAQQMREMQSRYDNMYDLIESARPTWLRSRGTTSFGNPDSDPDAPDPGLPAVFVDGVEQGRPEALRRIDPSDVAEAEYMSASDATTRYGTGYPGGIIRISTRSG